MPPAARGALFEKTAPLDPPQKLLIKGGHSMQPEKVFRQTMTAFGSFRVRRLKRRLKASIPFCKQIPMNFITFDILMHLLSVRFI
jgi:hypothetical protein